MGDLTGGKQELRGSRVAVVAQRFQSYFHGLVSAKLETYLGGSEVAVEDVVVRHVSVAIVKLG